MARGSSKETKDPEFRISNTNLQLKKDIINIAANLGVTYSQFLRKEIIKIRDSFPEEKRRPTTEY